jgi:hypothetical protein
VKMSSQGHFRQNAPFRRPTCRPSSADIWKSALDFDPIIRFPLSFPTMCSHHTFSILLAIYPLLMNTIYTFHGLDLSEKIA